MVAFVVLVTASVSLFGWSTLRWWSFDTNRSAADDTRPGPPSLILYTNDPNSLVTSKVSFFRDDTRQTIGFIDLKFREVQHPDEFRWALVGNGDMAFYFDQRLLGKDEPGPPPAFSPMTSSCTNGSRSTDTQSVLFGGLGNSLEVATGLEKEVALNEYVGYLIFPRLLPRVAGDQYSYEFGAIGRPTEANRRDLGEFKLSIFDECVDVTGLRDGVQGKLNATPTDWTIEVEPHSEDDSTLEFQPTANATAPRVWRTSGLQEDTTVTFRDSGLAQAHQAALFAAGIIGGISGSIAATWFTSGGLPSRRRRKIVVTPSSRVIAEDEPGNASAEVTPGARSHSPAPKGSQRRAANGKG